MFKPDKEFKKYLSKQSRRDKKLIKRMLKYKVLFGSTSERGYFDTNHAIKNKRTHP